MSQLQVLETPIKSENDKKDYRLIKLPNGLKALLIYKPTEDGEQNNIEDIAAVKLTIKVGSSDDPPHAMGLAHFLEHILFMGSTKYPVENSFTDFLSANGGHDNAMTGYENTSFFFDVAGKVLEDALDMFAHQFISPLLLKDAMQREREAVDSEYQMATSNDAILVESVLKSYIYESHPASQFDCGNLKTLKDDISDDDLHKELLKLHAKYVGNKMLLAIHSKKSLDEMQELVVKCFSSVKSVEDEIKNQTTNLDEIFKPEFFNKIIFLKPKTAKKSLIITWVLPSVQKHYKSSPLKYVASILDSDGEGGLSSYLKEIKLITGLSFYASESGHSGNSQFCMPKFSINLTDLGINNIDKILEAVFSYLLMIKEVSIEEHLRYFEELKENQHIKFKFRQEEKGLREVTNLINAMMLYDDVDILRGGSVFQSFDAKIISEVIESLNRRNFNILITNNERENYSKKEKYFGTDYDEEDFPQSYQKLWDEKKLNSAFHLEEQSPFKPRNFEIFVNPEESPKYPAKILEDEVYEVWHKLDDKFKNPRASVSIQMWSPKQMNSIQNFTYLNIYDFMISQYFDKILSKALSVGLVAFTNADRKGLRLEFTGFNDKMENFVEMVMKEMKAFNEKMEESLFETIREHVEKMIYNSLLESRKLNSSFVSKVLSENNYLYYDVYTETQRATFENLQKFVVKFFQELKIQVLVQGNLTKAQALNIVGHIKAHIECDPFASKYVLKVRCFQLPLGTSVLRIKSLMIDNDNSHLMNYYQIGRNTLHTRNLAKLIDAVLDSKAFDYLRNKEQLGYAVGCSLHEINGTLGIKVFVSSQEHKHSHMKVYEKLDIFMNEIAKKIINDLSDEDFENFKESRLKLLMASDKQLSEERRRNWDEILDLEYVFDRNQLAAKSTKSLTKSELQDFFKSFTRPESMRKLSIQVIGSKQVDEPVGETVKDSKPKIQFITEKFSENESVIENIEEFQSNLLLFPFPKFQI